MSKYTGKSFVYQDDLLFNAMQNPIRRAIVAALLDYHLSATNFADEHEMAISSIMRHLKVLEEAGLVYSTKHGRRRIYSLNRERLKDMTDWADLLEVDWMDSLLL